MGIIPQSKWFVKRTNLCDIILSKGGYMNFTEFQNKMLTCLQLQDELNSRINLNWKEERTESDFYRAIWLETAELMEELPWKWWERTETDYDNLQIEVVDIFHFLLSLILLKEYKWEKHESFRNYKNIIFPLFYLGLENSNKLNTNKLIIRVETIAKQSLSGNDTGLLLTFAEVVNTAFENFNQMYLLYIGKNMLNHIRQEYGYNTGTYKKVINGLEDNKYLTQIIKQVRDENELRETIRKAFDELQTNI